MFLFGHLFLDLFVIAIILHLFLEGCKDFELLDEIEEVCQQRVRDENQEVGDSGDQRDPVFDVFDLSYHDLLMVKVAYIDI